MKSPADFLRSAAAVGGDEQAREYRNRVIERELALTAVDRAVTEPEVDSED